MTFNPPNRETASRRLYEEETSVEVVAARYGLDPASILDFSLNVNPFGPPGAAVAAARDVLADCHLYPDLKVSRLRNAVAAKHAVAADGLFFGAGLDEVLKLIIHAWTRTGDCVLVHVPTFPRYELEARLRGCKVIEIANDAPEFINIEGMRRALAAQPITLTFLCTPNNPTGARLSSTDIRRLVSDFADTLFVVDEALICPLEEGCVPLPAQNRNIVVLRTFSKYYGLAGFRVGYAIADPQLVAIAEAGRPPFNIARPSVEAAATALSDTDFLESCRRVFSEERDWFIEAISGLRGISVCGSHANMLLVELAGRESVRIAADLAARGIVVADATSFTGLDHRNMLRISLRSRRENGLLVAALEEVI